MVAQALTARPLQTKSCLYKISEELDVEIEVLDFFAVSIYIRCELVVPRRYLEPTRGTYAKRQQMTARKHVPPSSNKEYEFSFLGCLASTVAIGWSGG